jgi:hypothetical protein
MKYTTVIFLFIGAALSGCSKALISEKPVTDNTEIVWNRWSPDHVWVPAHHKFKNGRYVRVRGQYQYEPRYKTTWAPARIVKTPRGKLWIADRWK